MKRYLLTSIVLLLIGVVFGGCSSQPIPRFEPGECHFSMPVSPALRRDVECGTLVVYEDRNNPDGRTLDLAVAIFHPPGGSVTDDPIIYLSGGPGGSVLEILEMNEAVFDRGFSPLFEAGRDVILFDQRGVGFSEPALDCPGFRELSLDLLDLEQEKEILSREEAFGMLLDELKVCHDTLGQITDLDQYNSVASAGDVEDLRVASGYETVNLFGVSYGTRLALEVLRQHPEHVRSVVLDSVYPPDADLYLEGPANFSRSLNMLFEACEADKDCNHRYPDLRLHFFETVDRLGKDPVRMALQDYISGDRYATQLDGRALILLSFQLLYETDVIPYLPQIMEEAYEGDFDRIRSVRNSLMLQGPMMSVGMMYSVQCHEEMPFSTFEMYETELEQYPQIADSLYFSNIGKMAYETCAFWGTGDGAIEANQAVVSDVPSLVLSGEFDPVTPPAWGQQVFTTLENGYFYVFPGVGHGVVSSGNCPMDVMVAFLENPLDVPDASCREENSLQIEIPSDLDEISLAEKTLPTLGIIVSVPVGWEQQDEGSYLSPADDFELIFEKRPLKEKRSFLLMWNTLDEAEESRMIDGKLWSYYRVIRPDAGAVGYAALMETGDEFFFGVLVLGAGGLDDEININLLTPILELFEIDIRSGE